MIDIKGFIKNLKEVCLAISKVWVFWLGLALKITLIFTFEPDLINELFVPFIQSFTKSLNFGVYDSFFQSGHKESFPYPAMMLYVLGSLQGVFQYLGGGEISDRVSGVLVRIPLLLSDFTLLLILARLLRGKIKDVVLFYWMSPAVFYMIYLHGQLDVVPMTMLFTSIYFIFRDRLIPASVFLGLSIACKINIVLVVPFFIIYLFFRNISFISGFRYLSITIASFLLVNIPFLGSEGFSEMVFNSAEQFRVFEASLNIKDYQIYLTPLFYILLIMKTLSLKSFSKDLLISLIGFAFGIILFFVTPSPGWYFWVLPFFIFSFVKFRRRLFPLLILFQILCITFFFLQNDYVSKDIFGSLSDYAENINFTLIQATLICLCILVYQNSIRALADYKIVSQPFLIGIGGDSGAGKSQISSNIVDIFSEDNSLVLRGDDMHKWQRGDENWTKLTHLNPKANDLYDEIRYLKTLKNNRIIKRRKYDHSNGKFTSEEVVKPKSVIIHEGLHPFYLSRQRELYDLKIFIKPEADLLQHWKIVRDLTKRKYDLNKVLEQIKSRETDSLKYIHVQEKYADLIVYVYSKEKIQNIGSEDEKVDLRVVLKISNRFNLEPLLVLFSNYINVPCKHEYVENDFQTLEMDVHQFTDEHIAKISEPFARIFDELSIGRPKWKNNFNGFLQLVVSYLILEIERDERT